VCFGGRVQQPYLPGLDYPKLKSVPYSGAAGAGHKLCPGPNGGEHFGGGMLP
jgi:hypothetical protein